LIYLFIHSFFCLAHFRFMSSWHCRCQTYEGGFAGCPGMEAHGGYSFCGLAALVMLGKQHLCDIRLLLVSIKSTLLFCTVQQFCSSKHDLFQRLHS